MFYTRFLVSILLFIISYVSCVYTHGNDEAMQQTKEDVTSSTFLFYSEALSNFIEANKGFNGNADAMITLPSWIIRRSDITTYVQAGVGYVFTPNKPGLYSDLVNKTAGSSQLGISGVSTIATISGYVVKPAAIPANQVVYIR